MHKENVQLLINSSKQPQIALHKHLQQLSHIAGSPTCSIKTV